MPLAVSATTRSGRSTAGVDERADVVGELGQQVPVLDPARLLGPLDQPGGDRFLDLDEPGRLADRRRRRPAHLDAVVLGRVVARGEHRGRRVEQPGGEVDEVRGGEADVDHVGAGEGRALDERLAQRDRRRAHVVARR